MKTLMQKLNVALTRLPMNLWLVRISSWSVAIGVLALVGVVMPRHAANRTELLLGLVLASLNCLQALMFGALAARMEVMNAPWRYRVWEWTSYVAGVTLLVLGMWSMTTLPLTRVGFMSAFLLLLAMVFAIFCAGMVVTLLRATPVRQPASGR